MRYEPFASSTSRFSSNASVWLSPAPSCPLTIGGEKTGPTTGAGFSTGSCQRSMIQSTAVPPTFVIVYEIVSMLRPKLSAFGENAREPPRGGSTSWLYRDGDRFVLDVGSRRLEACQVVVAMATYQRPRLPAFAADLDPRVVQLHSSEYRNPGQLPADGTALVVGSGNSGAEIALELSRRQRVVLAGRYPGHLPFKVDGLAGRVLLDRLVLRGLFHRVLTVDTPIGRKA